MLKSKMKIYFCLFINYLKRYSGRNCDLKTDHCRPNPCANGGKCIETVESFKCICSADYAGKLCDKSNFMNMYYIFKLKKN